MARTDDGHGGGTASFRSRAAFHDTSRLRRRRSIVALYLVSCFQRSCVNLALFVQENKASPCSAENAISLDCPSFSQGHTRSPVYHANPCTVLEEMLMACQHAKHKRDSRNLLHKRGPIQREAFPLIRQYVQSFTTNSFRRSAKETSPEMREAL